MASYSQVAAFAGNPKGARQVSRILHSCSKKHSLPWHRVINSRGMISLGGIGGEVQKQMLLDEGVEFDESGKIDLTKFGWYNQQN